MDQALRDRWLSRANRLVAASGMRHGPARTAVIELLAREGQCLLSAQEITSQLHDRGYASSASVYRALDDLYSLGLLTRMDGRDGVARYEISDEEGHHHHLIDDGTGNVTAFQDDRLERVISDVARELGYELTGHDIVLRGRPSQ